VFLLAFAAFFLISAGWAIALPANGTNDEDEHIIRAYGAASGQIYSAPAAAIRGGGAWFSVPRSLLPVNVDCAQKWELPASCQQRPPDDPSRIELGSAAGRYNPLYYVPVGLPMVLSPNMTGIVLGRLISGAMVAALLAAAVTIAVCRRSPLLLAALAVAASPNLLNLGGSINPSGLEVAAGILTWTALLTLVRARPGELNERWTGCLLLAAGGAGAVLASIRTLGPLLLGLTVLGCMVMARPGRVRELLIRRDTRRVGIGVGIVGIYGVAWTLFSGVLSNPPADPTPPHLSFTGKLGYIMGDRLTQWTAQLVGRFSYGEVTAPNAMLVVWYGLAFVIFVPTVLLATRRQALTIIGIVVLSTALLVGFELLYYSQIGWAQQSRYVLPFGVGALLYAGCLRRWERTFGPVPTQRFLFICGSATAAMHVWALAVVMTRFQVTQRFKALGALHGAWLPAVGPQIPLLATATGGVLLVVLVIRAKRVESTMGPAADADREMDELIAESSAAVVPASRLPSGETTLDTPSPSSE
jgi:xanthosine utilization system XapX-like protein